MLSWPNPHPIHFSKSPQYGSYMKHCDIGPLAPVIPARWLSMHPSKMRFFL